jgi:AmmeMemoRadiSam system protein A
VVGYFSAYLVAGAPPAEFTLTSEEKKELLELAREVIRHFVEEQKVKEYSPKNESLRKEKGAFVTLKKRGALRGCIGYVEGVYPLYETVMQAAVLAATEDPRFPPVTKEELKDLEIEISVLSPLQQIKDPSLVQVGKHGLVISQAEYRGLLLPQVATENRWSRETFLDEACLKAGLPADAWKKGAKIQIFEAIVFR